MKILSIGYRYPKVSRYNSSAASLPAHSNINADTVSFKASSNIIEKDLKDLEATFSKNILPFMKDSKDLYNSVAKIGYTIQEGIRSYKEINEELFRYKLGLSFANNPAYNKYSKAINLITAYDNNCKVYNFIKNSAEKNGNKNTELTKKITAAKEYYTDNKDVSKLRYFYNFYNDSAIALDKKLQELNFKNESPLMHEKFISLHDKYTECIVYTTGIPYHESIKLKNSIKNIKDSITKPHISKFDILEHIQKTSNRADSIKERTGWFYDNKPEIEKFVKDNSRVESIIPKKEELLEEYKKIKEKSDSVFEKHNKLVIEYYNGVMELYEPDIVKLEKLVKKQQNINKELTKII